MSKLSERWDAIEDNPLLMVDTLSKIWAEEAKDYMDDEDFGKVLDLIIKLISENSIDPAKVPMCLVKLEAYATSFRMKYVAYMSYHKGTQDANMKKNHYKELYVGIDRLVDSLKYLVR